MKLGSLQQTFQHFLLTGEPTMRPYVVGTPTCDADTRLGVYYDAYRLRLIEALEADFVALKAYVGAEQFEEIGRAYIDAWPSTHPSLRYFGQHLGRFLAEDGRYREEPVLSELATFDWVLIDAFDAEDKPLLAIESIAEVAPEYWPSMRFIPHPSLRRIDLQWNAPEIWLAADQKQALPPATRGPHPRAWVIWRKELNSFFRELQVDEAWALDALAQDATFGEICEGLTEWIDAQNVAGHAATLLKGWVTEGMLHHLSFETR